MSAQPIPTALRRAVYVRDRGCCQRCGRACLTESHSIQHRRPRQMGGDAGAHTMANLVLLCGSATTGCHGHVESYRIQAYADGWLVRRHDDPAAVPVLRFGRTRTLVAERWPSPAPPTAPADVF